MKYIRAIYRSILTLICILVTLKTIGDIIGVFGEETFFMILSFVIIFGVLIIIFLGIEDEEI